MANTKDPTAKKHGILLFYETSVLARVFSSSYTKINFVEDSNIRNGKFTFVFLFRFCCCCFETGSHMAQAGCKLSVAEDDLELLALPSADVGGGPHHQAQFVHSIN